MQFYNRVSNTIFLYKINARSEFLTDYSVQSATVPSVMRKIPHQIWCEKYLAYRSRVLRIALSQTERCVNEGFSYLRKEQL